MLDWYIEASVHYSISLEIPCLSKLYSDTAFQDFLFRQPFYSVTGSQWWGGGSRMSPVVPTFSQLAHPNKSPQL